MCSHDSGEKFGQLGVSCGTQLNVHTECK